MKTGMRSIGAAAATVVPPACTRSPFQASLHSAPAGFVSAHHWSHRRREVPVDVAPHRGFRVFHHVLPQQLVDHQEAVAFLAPCVDLVAGQRKLTRHVAQIDQPTERTTQVGDRHYAPSTLCYASRIARLNLGKSVSVPAGRPVLYRVGAFGLLIA
ncbi:MAG: hypothetical protein OXC12_19410 [Spirochaetaceae bacterium]|nr:hypothetical protein [Spirochaetaceae bacterium]